jgi:hypothetical protein
MVLPVHQHVGAPEAGQMVCGGQQNGLAGGRAAQCQDRKRQQQADEYRQQGRLPVVGVDQRSGPGEFRPQRCVEDAPVRPDIALEQFLRLIDRLDDVVVDATRVGGCHEIAQQHGLADRIGHRALEIVPGAGPAELADHDFLARIFGAQLVVERERPLERGLLRHALPVGENMGEHLVDGVDELGVVDEGFPMVRCRHRNRTVPFHAPDNFCKLCRAMLVP